MEKATKHRVVMSDRSFLSIEGVNHVGSFDEKEIVLETQMGVMLIKGEDLHITQLNLDEGSLTVEGFVVCIEYSEDKEARSLKNRGKGILDKLFK